MKANAERESAAEILSEAEGSSSPGLIAAVMRSFARFGNVDNLGNVTAMSLCSDKVIGDILAGWRYDISGLAPEMRGDYEQHLAECVHCHSRQVLHRTIDIVLMIVATVSAFMFLVAFGAVRHFSPRNALTLELIALAGFLFFSVVWLVVAVATPAPVVVADVARIHARRIQSRLPSQIRDRLPESIRSQEKVG